MRPSRHSNVCAQFANASLFMALQILASCAPANTRAYGCCLKVVVREHSWKVVQRIVGLKGQKLTVESSKSHFSSTRAGITPGTTMLSKLQAHTLVRSLSWTQRLSPWLLPARRQGSSLWASLLHPYTVARVWE
jgi:hypothetical protein